MNGGTNQDFAENGSSSRMAAGVPFTMREWWRSKRLRHHLLALILAIAFFTYLGPFGTGARLSPAELVVYWTLAMSVNWGIALSIIPFSVRTLKQAGRTGRMGVVIGALIAALPGTAVVFALEWWLGGPLDSAAFLVYLYSCVALVFLVLGFLARQLIEKPLREEEEGEPGAAEATPALERALLPPPPPRHDGAGAERAPARPEQQIPFLSRLPAQLGRDLLHLHMQDHYVEVHTAKGSTLVLMRFRDALREVDGIDGMQVHRSHWVAGVAVARMVRRGGRVFLKLTNGSEVPVSRTFAPALKDRGWR